MGRKREGWITSLPPAFVPPSQIFQSPAANVFSLSFSPDGELLVLGGDKVYVFAVDDRRFTLLETHSQTTEGVHATAFSPALLVAGGWDGRVQLYRQNRRITQSYTTSLEAVEAVHADGHTRTTTVRVRVASPFLGTPARPVRLEVKGVLGGPITLDSPDGWCDDTEVSTFFLASTPTPALRLHPLKQVYASCLTYSPPSRACPRNSLVGRQDRTMA